MASSCLTAPLFHLALYLPLLPRKAIGSAISFASALTSTLTYAFATALSDAVGEDAVV